jgi:hypothetical protein
MQQTPKQTKNQPRSRTERHKQLYINLMACQAMENLSIFHNGLLRNFSATWRPQNHLVEDCAGCQDKLRPAAAYKSCTVAEQSQGKTQA